MCDLSLSRSCYKILSPGIQRSFDWHFTAEVSKDRDASILTAESKNNSLRRRTGYITEGRRMNDYSNRNQSITYRKENYVVRKA